MCWVVYIASDSALPLIAWNEASRAFNVRPVEADARARVQHHFSLPHLVEAGSHQGCACGFSCGLVELENDQEREEEAASIRALDSLAEYIAQAASRGQLQLYACWIGDEQIPEQARATVSPSYFRRRPFEFEDRKLLTIEIRS